MKMIRNLSRQGISFMKQSKDLSLKDPLRDLKVSVKEMQSRAFQKQIFRTQTGFVPLAIQMKTGDQNNLAIFDKKLDIPYNLEGIDKVPDEKTSFLGESLFQQNKVKKDKLYDYLLKIYKGVIYSMAAQDIEFLNEYTEKGFADRLIASLKELQQKGDELIAFEDVIGDKYDLLGDSIPYKCIQVEIALIKGLSVDRSQNLNFQQYHIWKDIDDMGFVSFTPENVQDPKNFIHKKQGEEIMDNFQNMIMRVLVRIQSPLRLKVLQQNGQVYYIQSFKYTYFLLSGQKLIVSDEQNYSYNHMAIFESQLIKPDKFSSFYKLENYQQWLNKFQLGTWKLVDIDNWMDGNPLIIQGGERAQYKDSVFDGTQYDSKYLIDIKNV